MDLLEGLRERRHPAAGPPLLGNHVGDAREVVERAAHPRAEPSLDHPFRQGVTRNDTPHMQVPVRRIDRLEFGVVELEAAERLDRAGEVVSLPHLERRGEIGLIEPGDSYESGLIAEGPREIPPPPEGTRSEVGEGRREPEQEGRPGRVTVLPDHWVVATPRPRQQAAPAQQE